MFRRLFGDSKSKDNQHRQTMKTIDQLQQTEQIINKKIEKFDDEINETQNKARQCLDKTNPDKYGAMKFLKRKKQFQEQRNKLFQIKENIELVNQQVQSAHFNQQITETLNIGQKHLKKTHKSMSNKNIEEILENISQQIDISQEINDLLSTPITTNDSFNINDMENELNNLNKQIITENLTKINLPNAHSDKIQIKKSSMNNHIDQQLEELQRLTTG